MYAAGDKVRLKNRKLVTILSADETERGVSRYYVEHNDRAQHTVTRFYVQPIAIAGPITKKENTK